MFLLLFGARADFRGAGFCARRKLTHSGVMTRSSRSRVSSNHTMKTVKLHRNKLLVVLTDNRAKHRELFEKAFDGYRQECITILTTNLELLHKNKRQIVHFGERPPEDHTAEYDQVIRMLEMSVDEVVELSHSEFSQYVQDDWNWKQSWSVSNMKYTERP